MKGPASTYAHREGDLLRNLMDNSTDHIYFKDLASRFICVNRSMAEWMHLDDPAEVIGKTDFDIFSEAHARPAFEDEQEIIRSGVDISGKEEKETWPDGHETWVSTTKMPLRDSDGCIIGTFGISRDITAHKLAEERIERYARDMQEINAEMERDLAMASELQQALLPQRYPCFPPDAAPADSAATFCHYYRPAHVVGGDFFSVRALSDTAVSIFVCDVLGHGVRSALVTAIVRTLAEELAADRPAPGVLLSRINRRLLPILRQSGMIVFASALCLTLDLRTGQIHFANAGHPCPLRVPPGREAVQRLCPEDALCAGPALGMCEEYDYATGVMESAPGDRLLLFTDGLFEIDNPLGEQFGFDRLVNAIEEHSGKPLPALVDGVIGAARRFAAGEEFNDDVCLVGMQVHRLLA